MAKKEDFIVMGRCADVVLTNHRIPHISIFITASFEQRVHRMMELHNLNYKQAAHLLVKLDARHAKYYLIIPVRSGEMPLTMIYASTVQATVLKSQ